jgi:hypothetical protein
MAYRSDVAVAMRRRDWDAWELQRSKKRYTEDYTYFDSWDKMIVKPNEIRDEQYEFIVVNWSYVKWDEATDEVIEDFMDFLNQLRKDELPFRFIRVGEGVGTDSDIEDFGYWDGKTQEGLRIYNAINWETNIKIS